MLSNTCVSTGVLEATRFSNTCESGRGWACFELQVVSEGIGMRVATPIATHVRKKARRSSDLFNSGLREAAARFLHLDLLPTQCSCIHEPIPPVVCSNLSGPFEIFVDVFVQGFAKPHGGALKMGSWNFSRHFQHLLGVFAGQQGGSCQGQRFL